MHIALEMLKFSFFLMAWFLFFLGLGWFFISLLMYDRLLPATKKRRFFEEIPIAILVGIIVNYCLLLVFQSIKCSLIVSGILSIIGLTFFIISFFKTKQEQYFPKNSLFVWILLPATFFILLIPTITTPIQNWDARTMWFFHAKMIYYAKSIGFSAGWTAPFVDATHIDYPNLVASIASQISFIAGYWNDYLPKLSLFFIYIPAVTWLWSFAKRTFSFLFLIILIPFFVYPVIWNGYMDGILAVYGALSFLLLYRYIQNANKFDLFALMTCLFAILNIKNEGALFIVATCFSLLYLVIKNRQNIETRKILKWKYVLFSLLGFVPYAIWQIDLKIWGVKNDLGVGSMDSFTMLFGRLSDGSIKIVIEYMIRQLNPSLLIIILLILIMIFWGVQLKTQITPVLIATSVYFLGLMCIYLLTPYDLIWHLNMSVNRTMLVINGLIYITCYFLLKTIELNQTNPQIE